jgi:hypothetical protein
LISSKAYLDCAGSNDNLLGSRKERRLTCKGDKGDNDVDKAWGYFFGQIWDSEECSSSRVSPPPLKAPPPPLLV